MVKGNNSGQSRLARFWSSASGFWRGKSAVVSWPLTIGLLLIGVSQLTVQYRLNYWNRDFFNALARRDSNGLWDQVVIFIPLACLSVALAVTSVWTRMTTQRKWREWLTTNILDSWLSRDRYRRLASVSGEFQNAEYRISFDARLATDAPVDLTLGFITSASDRPRIHRRAVECRRQLAARHRPHGNDDSGLSGRRRRNLCAHVHGRDDGDRPQLACCRSDAKPGRSRTAGGGQSNP